MSASDIDLNPILADRLYYKASREGAYRGWYPVIGADGKHVKVADTDAGYRKQWEYWTVELKTRKLRFYARGHRVYPHWVKVAAGSDILESVNSQE